VPLLSIRGWCLKGVNSRLEVGTRMVATLRLYYRQLQL
jgi:hypothetical protein